MNALIYGWAMQAGMGAAIWLVARRTGAVLQRGAGTLVTAGIFWNIGVTLGVAGIFCGAGTSLQWLEFPVWVWPVLMLAFLMIAWRLVAMFLGAPRTEGFQISTWYVIGACLWFPWIYLTSNLFLNTWSLDGPLGAVGAGINAWYVSTLILLVLAPLGLGACYYFIPKITGQPIASAPLAVLGFWSLAVLGGWTGCQKYMGGPLPAWMPAVGGAAALLLVIPAVIVALNHHLTTAGKHSMIQTSPTLRFTFVGSFSYVIMSVVAALLGTFWFGSTVQFTYAEYGFHMLAVYGFFSMSMFGAIYYIVPRLAGCEWLSARLIRQHFWYSVYGIAALVACMLVGGMAQGGSVNSPDNWNLPFVGAIVNSRGYLVGRTLAWVFILWSNLWFFVHLLMLVFGLGRRGMEPTLLETHHEEAAATA
jgi:cytochrome c oxidase cbb3-type subunit 1